MKKVFQFIKTEIIFNIFKIKRIAVFCFFAAAFTAAWTDTFKWTSTLNGAWDEGANWTKTSGGSSRTYPQDQSDTAEFPFSTNLFPINVNITSNITINKLQLNHSAGNVNLITNSRITVNEIEISSSAKLQIKGDITVKNTLNNDAGGNFVHTDGTFTAAPVSNTLSIKSSDTAGEPNTQFHNFKCTEGGKTLSIGGKIKVNGNLELRGNQSAKLIIKGDSTGVIHITNDTSHGEFLDSYTDQVSIEGRKYTLKKSFNKGAPYSGILGNWKLDYEGEMVWTAGAAADKKKWDKPGNWNIGGIPGENTTVRINKISASIYPELTGDVNAKSVNVEADASLDLSEYIITAAGAVTAKIENYGTLKLKGTASQKNWFTAAAENKVTLTGEKSTVVYYGNLTGEIYGGNGSTKYINLKTEGKNLSAGSITIKAKKFTAEGTAELQSHLETEEFSAEAGCSFGTSAGTNIKVSKLLNIAGQKFESKGTLEFTGNSEFKAAPASALSIQLKDVTGGSNPITLEIIPDTGTVRISGNCNTPKLEQTSGIIEINGTAAQTLHTKKLHNLTITNTHQVSLKTEEADKITNAAELTLQAPLKVKTGLEDNGSFDASSYEVTFTGNNSELTGNSLKDKTKFKHITVASAGKLTLKKDITVTEKLENKGSLSEIGAAGTVYFSPVLPNTEVKFTGTSNAADTYIKTANFTNSAGKTFTVEGKVSIGKMILSGGTGVEIADPAETDLLTVKGEGDACGINLKEAQGTAAADLGKYLKVGTNLPIISGNKFTTKKSKAFEIGVIEAAPNVPANWIFKDYAGELVWTGRESADWDRTENWLPYGLPFEKTDVKIYSKCNNYPKLKNSAEAKASSVTVDGSKNLKGGTSEKKAALDLAEYLITSPRIEITGGGILRLYGTDSQKTKIGKTGETGKEILIASAASSPAGISTVEYYGAALPSINIWEGAYHNLIINDKIEVKASALTVEDNTEIVKADSIESKNQNYKGTVTVKSDTIFKIPAGTITFAEKITAAGKNLTFAGGEISSKKEITAAKIEVEGVIWKANDITCTGKITVKSETWETKGTITAENEIETQAPFNKWESYDSITAKKSITVPAAANWTAFAGTIEVKGDFTAEKFNQTGGEVVLTGTAAQILKADSLNGLTVNNTGTGTAVQLIFNRAGTLTVQAGKAILKKDIVLTKAFTNSGGIFDAFTDKKVINLEPENVLTVTGKQIVSGEEDTVNNNTGTKLYKLHCKNAGQKTLKFSGDIEILHEGLNAGGEDDEALILTGADSNRPLSIEGFGKIWFNETAPYNQKRPKKGGKYLRLITTADEVDFGVQIRGGAYRVIDGIYTGKPPRNWIFEEYSNIISSLAIANTKEVLIKFTNPVKKPLDSTLKISDTGTMDFRSKKVYPYPKTSAENNSDKWIFEFGETFTPELLLKNDVTLSLGQDILDPIFIGENSDIHPEKSGWISDIGLNLVTPLFAVNTSTIRNFDGTGRLPFLNTKIPVAVPIDGKSLTMYLDTEFSDRYWLNSKPSYWKNSYNEQYNPASALFNFEIPASSANQKIFILPKTHPKIKQESAFEFMLYYSGLPCARLKDENDILSFDVWRFSLLKSVLQRGGVSILNNVIDPNKGQKTTIEITTKKDGILTIQIMTIDGNILKTLERSQKKAGNYSYYWDGTNSSGTAVAKGIYFVRIAGADIDEMRKVMVVRE